MKYIKQFEIILAISLIGELLNRLIPLPIPASIYGIVLLYISLELKIVKIENIKAVSTTLIMAMPIMFVPPAVGLLNNLHYMKAQWPKYLAITFISTFVVMAAAGWVTQYIIEKKKNRKKT